MNVIELVDGIEREQSMDMPEGIYCEFEFAYLSMPANHNETQTPVCTKCGTKYYRSELSGGWTHPFNDT